MKRMMLPFLTMIAVGCGTQGTVTETWLSVSDYSMEVESADQGTQMSVPPSLRVESYDTVFTNKLGFELYYPTAEDRLDVALVSIFSSDEPEVILPKVKVEADYMVLDTLIEDIGFDNPVFGEGKWKELNTYTIKSGREKRIEVPKAAGHKLVVVRCLVSIKDGGETTGGISSIRYMFGFELE